ncbi:EAL domain-containing protein [Cronobacter sakazakii]|uniref:sensor domain-containing phosphodiesterase n=1 Tax=Cronobacter sakazakii TaxID=28141 RepID=UPI000CFB5FF3|nr:EAL domain-containing protein [Cronobacter sakazakii]EKM1387921.1 sensor domain-containing phosphodiesterase [Cronobacter sakazakii]EKM6428821.1 sensor domain-containing phosphodiesterase [Cronobacter sakazakii]ELY7523419.1 sensor domain-containing phosphodiesterase [Cronobacter sakazakii]ELZ1659933.1 sensor domain-containing phosphodiesterase [Cronobacter sakazakii]UWT88460.1 sensor domain-containing phosphodiesterase [Cronobacter sakazakii]
MNARYGLRKSGIALLLCVLLLPLARLLSPKAIVDGAGIYLTFLPLSLMLAMIYLFGRYALFPLVITFLFFYGWFFPLNSQQLLAFIASFLLPVILTCAILRALKGPRWRFAISRHSTGLRLFLPGLLAPCLIKFLMVVSGYWLDYPEVISSYFGESTSFYSVVTVQGLMAASVIFADIFYYPVRMALSPAFARAFWHRCVIPLLAPEKKVLAAGWFAGVFILLILFLLPFKLFLISIYTLPVIFVLFTAGIFLIGPVLITLLWSFSLLLLLGSSSNFLPAEKNGFLLAFMLSGFIAFTVSMRFMTVIFNKSEWMKRQYRMLALTDPLTRLPNLRALERHLQGISGGALCCLRVANLEFLSRHYGLMMRIQCKKEVTTLLLPWLNTGEKVFQLPDSDLLIYLAGPEPQSRLRHLVDLLNSKRIQWNGAQLELDYSAAWAPVPRAQTPEELYRTIGQLSYLAEVAGPGDPVVALESRSQGLSGQTSEPVLMLQKVKQALSEGGVTLFAQPIQNAQGEGYAEILARLECDGELIMPAKFIPLITRFNLSARFDMQVLEKLLVYLHTHPQTRPGARFSVNLMPLTLEQQGIAQQAIALFERYRVPISAVILEVTEEQALSGSENTVQNIALLQARGFCIAIDDFGTGYANFERLKNLQADIIKIDGCFIRNVVSNTFDALVVKSICDLAKARSLTVVAEFVETPAQRDLLFALGVEYIQGHLPGRPERLERQA